MVSDKVGAYVDIFYDVDESYWGAIMAASDSGAFLAVATGNTRAEALRNLAQELEGTK